MKLARLCFVVAAGDNPVKVTKTDEPEKALLFEVTVPAKLDDVWRAFTTKEGAQEWLWPDMTVVEFLEYQAALHDVEPARRSEAVISAT